MIVYPNAKINLGLNVVEKRPDGFHNLETIFYPIGLCDILELVEAEEMVFSNSGITIDCSPEDNLVWKAYMLLKEKYELPNAKIHLHKVIPFGAGLGGGSADAAFMLKLTNDYFQLNISEDELIETAAKLGSDCAFFIKNKPCYAVGKGDELKEMEWAMKPGYWVLVKPDAKVSTPDAYRWVKPLKSTDDLRDVVKMPVADWKNKLKNDFEASVFKQYPEIEQVKNNLYDMGAEYACMSGSGASVFGYFTEMPDITNKFDDSCFVWTGEIK
ncbi:4-(cytidine 5'-diphospho)-2-C-methyl-D-erythritol kinase [Prolixibacteraceae bacterium JC049]|nr:4-(cytidine 5'-diphospho)-2-C-methyl-D-erythritol kinase [Prolixibacteraceae bacterium JC049]